MILIVPEKSFHKKIEKWVIHRDFVIAMAVDRDDQSTYQYGNTMPADELSGTPALIKIAEDPTNSESIIKKRHVQRYLDGWFNDPGLKLRVHQMICTILRHWKDMGEDLNVFLVQRTPIYYAYADKLAEHINEDYGVEVAFTLNHKMSKDTIKELLNKPVDKSFMKRLRKNAKKAQRNMDLTPEDRRILGMDADPDDDGVCPFDDDD